jgi:YYY domain-containing protein
MSEALRWVAVIELLGLAVFPLTATAFRALPDRGFCVSKAAGLVLVTYLLWAGNIAHVLPNSFLGALAAAVALGAVSAAVARGRSRAGIRWLREHWATVLAAELLFVVAFSLTGTYKAFTGQIFFSEKVMDFMYLNSVDATVRFPPRDAWFAGSDVSYYYFGYVVVDVLARLAHVRTEVAFNLAIATIAGVAANAVYGLVYAYVERSRAVEGGAASRAGETRGSVLWGISGACAMFLVGNLVELFVFASAYGIGAQGFYDWLQAGHLEAGVDRYLWYPSSGYSFVPAIQVIPVDRGFLRSFLETPLLSIVQGDLHPHFIGLMSTLLGIVVAFSFYLDDEAPALGQWRRHSGALALRAVLAGSAGAVNTWDFPFVAAAVVAAILLGARRREAKLADALPFAGSVCAAMVVAYAPFYLAFPGGGDGVFAVVSSETVVYPGSRFVNFLLHWGTFVWVVVFALLVVLSHRIERRWAAAGLALGMCVVAAWFIAFGIESATDHWRLAGAHPLADQLRDRGSGWASAAVLIGLVALLFAAAGRVLAGRGPEAFLVALALLGTLGVLGVEFFYVGEYFNTRVITLFKVGYTAWTFLGVASLFAAYELFRPHGPVSRVRGTTPRVAARALPAATAAVGLLLPLGALPARLHPRPMVNIIIEPRTLDGMAIWQADDRAAIAFLRRMDNRQRHVILEAPHNARGISDYSQSGRISAATGIPTLIGWLSHEAQWRGTTDQDLRPRAAHADAMYMTPNAQQTRALMRRYGVDLVYIGPLEYEVYGPDVAARFDGWPVVFHAGNATVYAVPGD